MPIGTPHSGRASPARTRVGLGQRALARRRRRTRSARGSRRSIARQRGLDELARRDLAGAHERGLLDGAQPEDVVVDHCHRLLVVQVDRSLHRRRGSHMRAGTQFARRPVRISQASPWACAHAVAAARALRPETPILP